MYHPGDPAQQFAHDSLGGTVPGPSRSSEGPCYRSATHARDSSIDLAHLDTVTDAAADNVSCPMCTLADLVSFLPAPCYCVVYSSVNDELSFVTLACAEHLPVPRSAIGVSGALCSISSTTSNPVPDDFCVWQKKQATNKRKIKLKLSCGTHQGLVLLSPTGGMAHPWKPLYRRKNIAKIFYASRVISNFVPNFVAMATGVGRGKCNWQHSMAHPRKPPIGANIAQKSFTQAEL